MTNTPTQTTDIYDIAIIGGGISGGADAYVFAKYTNAQRIALADKEAWWAQVTTAPTSNSQSLHRGYYETNFSPEKTRKLKEDGGWTQGFVERNAYVAGLAEKGSVMVIGVGEEETHALEQRYSWAKEIFPDLELIGRERIAELEPNVMKGRDPDVAINALWTPNGYTVDYGKLTATLIERARTDAPQKTLDTLLNEEMTRIERTDAGMYRVRFKGGRELEAKAVIVSAGAHSLRFAQALGYGKDYIELPVAGNFYYAPDCLNGKVYTVQREGLPFAAVHGDPDLAAPGKTRFGPTAIAMPLMERGDLGSSFDYFGTIKHPLRALRSVQHILSDKLFLGFMRENLRYLGPNELRNFLPSAQKVVPSLRLEDLERARDEHGDSIGGLRPQVVDTRVFEEIDPVTGKLTRTHGKMLMGEVKIHGDATDRLIFNVTPSPGASVGMANARKDAILAAKEWGYTFDDEAFKRDHAPSI